MSVSTNKIVLADDHAQDLYFTYDCFHDMRQNWAVLKEIIWSPKIFTSRPFTEKKNLLAHALPGNLTEPQFPYL